MFGGYDNIQEQPEIRGVEYYLFTDKDIVSNTWKVVKDPRYKQLNPRMRAKFFKIMSHEIFPHERCAYIDANMAIQPDYLGLWKAGTFALFKHPEGRDCIYQEYEYCKDFPKYKDQPMKEQVEHYKNNGFPEHYGLWACGNLFRDNASGFVKGLNTLWWQENLKWSYQDQLSFPYSLWRARRKFDSDITTIYENQYSGEYFNITRHNNDSV
jgi:hypothetical protein